MAYPDYEQSLQNLWGWDDETDFAFWWPYLSSASNILIGTNPPYSATDFFAWFPQFGGTPAVPQGTLTNGSATVTAISSMAGLAAGQAVAGTGIPSGTTIASVNVAGSSLVLSNPATYTGVAPLTIYVAPLVPLPVLNSYIYLATNSILQVRYCEMWSFVMALYIAHYLTLYLQLVAGGAGSTPGQVAASGLAMGIRIAKSVGDVSVGSQPLKSFEDWGSYALTSYGQQLITFGKAVGSGGVLCI
jgi:hypothetical protein